MQRTELKNDSYDFIFDLTKANQSEFLSFCAKLEAGGTQGMYRETLATDNDHPLLSFRANDAGRVLAAEITVHVTGGRKHGLILLAYLDTHKYVSSPFYHIKGHLDKFLEKNLQAFESQVRLHCNQAVEKSDHPKKIQTEKPIIHFGQCVFLSEEQFTVLNDTARKKIIIGMPGSGKTMLQLELVKKFIENNVESEKRILLLVQSDLLAYETREAIKDMELNQAQLNIRIMTWRNFLLSEAGFHVSQLMSKEELSDWVEKYLVKLTNKNNPLKMSILEEGKKCYRKASDIIIQEFNVIAVNTGLHDYVEGHDLFPASHFKQKDQRVWLKEAFDQYQAYLKEIKRIDADLLLHHKFTENSQGGFNQPYDAVFCDESQNASLSTLKLCCDLFEEAELTLLYDHDQAIEDIFSKTNFVQQYSRAAKYSLTGSYRCPPSLLDFLEAIIHLKRKLTGGLTDNDQKRDIQYSKSQIAYHADSDGYINYFESEKIEPAFLEKIKVAARVGILSRFSSDDELKKQEVAAIRKQYGSAATIFNHVKELQGIELDYLIVHHYFNVDSFDEINNEIKSNPSYFSASHLNAPTNKAKQGQENFQYEIALNELVVLSSRSRKGLVFVQPASKQVLRYFITWLKESIDLIKAKRAPANLESIRPEKESDEALSEKATKLVLIGKEDEAAHLLMDQLKKSVEEVNAFVKSIKQEEVIVPQSKQEVLHDSNHQVSRRLKKIKSLQISKKILNKSVLRPEDFMYKSDDNGFLNVALSSDGKASLVSYNPQEEVQKASRNEEVKSLFASSSTPHTPTEKERKDFDLLLDRVIAGNQPKQLHWIIKSNLAIYPMLISRIIFEKKAYGFFKTTYLCSADFLRELTSHPSIVFALKCEGSDHQSVLNYIVTRTDLSDVELLFTFNMNMAWMADFEGVQNKLRSHSAILAIDQVNSACGIQQFCKNNVGKYVELTEGIDADCFLKKAFDNFIYRTDDVSNTDLYSLLTHDVGTSLLLAHFRKNPESIQKWANYNDTELIKCLLTSVGMPERKMTVLHQMLMREGNLGHTLFDLLISNNQFFIKLVKHKKFFEVMTSQAINEQGDTANLVSYFTHSGKVVLLVGIISDKLFNGLFNTMHMKYGKKHSELLIEALLTNITVRLNGGQVNGLPALYVLLAEYRDYFYKLIHCTPHFLNALITHERFPASLVIESETMIKGSKKKVVPLAAVIGFIDVKELSAIFNNDIFLNRAFNIPSFLFYLLELNDKFCSNLFILTSKFLYTPQVLAKVYDKLTQSKVDFNLLASVLTSQSDPQRPTIFRMLSMTAEGVTILKKIVDNKALLSAIVRLKGDKMLSWLQQVEHPDKDGDSAYRYLAMTRAGRQVLEKLGMTVTHSLDGPGLFSYSPITTIKQINHSSEQAPTPMKKNN